MTRSQRGRIGWALVGVSLLLTWGTLRNVPSTRGLARPHGLAGWVDLTFLVSPIGAALATIAFTIAVLALVLDRGRPLAATVIAAELAMATHLGECQWPEDIGVAHGTAMPGAAMLAYAVASFAARRRAHAERAELAVEAACGIVAASYVLAGASKLTGSGLAWADGRNLALHIASHSLVGVEWLRPLRLAVGAQLALCTALGAATLIVECSFALFVVRRARPVYAFLALGMHVSISALMGLHHYDWLCMTLGLAVASAPEVKDGRAR